MRSTTRFEKPHSLSYHETILWKLSVSEMPAVASTIDEFLLCTKSVDTTASSVKPRMPAIGPVDAALSAAMISSYDAPLLSVHVRSTTETSGVGTRNAMPVSLPLSSGSTLPTALAAPVEDGMMLAPAPRPPRQSFFDGPSTVFWVAVVACTVVMRPSLMPKLSLITLASGARQLVVHDALEMTCIVLGSYFSSLTPMTNMGASGDGAEMTTFLAPPSMCFDAASTLVKTPVASTTKSTSFAPHGMSLGSRHSYVATFLPSTKKPSSEPSTSTDTWPCTESYLNMYAM